MKMSSQQIGDAALSIFQANRDDQVRMDRMLREFFSDVRETEREEEFKRQLRAVSEEMGKCVIFTSDLPSHLSGAL
jgi:hypothetical protein